MKNLIITSNNLDENINEIAQFSKAPGIQVYICRTSRILTPPSVIYFDPLRVKKHTILFDHFLQSSFGNFGKKFFL